MDLLIATDDPRRADVRALLETHVTFAREVTPPGHVHALEIDGLVDPAVTFVSARRHGELLGVGALRHLDEHHAELKSMHTAKAARGQGVGRAMVEHLLTVARGRGYDRVSLETGTTDAFIPARSLYADLGFVPCEPFGAYTANPHSACMSVWIGVPLRTRLQEALRAALKARDQAAINAFRSALAAIGNAEAVDASDELGPEEGPIAGARAGLGAGDAPRRELAEREMAHLVLAEVAERRSAADLYVRSAEPDRAERLLAEAVALEALMP